MDTFPLEIMDYSSLPLDQFYYMKVEITDAVSPMTIEFIYRPRYFSEENSQFEGYIDGHPFVLLNPSNHNGIFKFKSGLFYRFLISTSSIKMMRLIEKKEGPLFINWKYISSDLKTFLFG